MPNEFDWDKKPNLFLFFYLQYSISWEYDLSQTSIKVSFWSQPPFRVKKCQSLNFSSRENHSIVFNVRVVCE